MNIRRNIILFGILFAMGTLFASCELDNFSKDTETKEETGGGSSSGSGENGNTSGGNGESTGAEDGSDIDITSFEKFSATFTNGTYESLASSKTTEMLAILLSDDDYDWNTAKGEGNWAIIEIFVKKGAGITPGKYCLSDSMAIGTSYICQEGEDDTVSGPMFGTGGYAFVCPNAGYVEISKSGSKYTINILYIDEQHERYYEGSFTGSIEESESGSGSESESDQDVEFTQCEAEFYGAYNEAGDWVIYFGEKNTDMSDLTGGAWAMIELFTQKTTYVSELPTGTFEINDSENAGTACSIYEKEDGYYYGTMFGKDDSIETGATSGSVKISKNGSTYTIEMNLIDDDYGTSFNYT